MYDEFGTLLGIVERGIFENLDAPFPFIYFTCVKHQTISAVEESYVLEIMRMQEGMEFYSL